jgi:hypothetical protein
VRFKKRRANKMKAMFTNQDFQLDAGSEIVPSRCIIDENDKSKNISLLCDIIV